MPFWSENIESFWIFTISAFWIPKFDFKYAPNDLMFFIQNWTLGSKKLHFSILWWQNERIGSIFCMQMHSQVTFHTDIEISLSVLVFSSEKDFFVSSKKLFKFFTSVSRGYLKCEMLVFLPKFRFWVGFDLKTSIEIHHFFALKHFEPIFRYRNNCFWLENSMKLRQFWFFKIVFLLFWIFFGKTGRCFVSKLELFSFGNFVWEKSHSALENSTRTGIFIWIKICTQILYKLITNTATKNEKV